MVLLAVLTAVVIGVTIHPGSQLRSVLGWEPLRWVGERSYAIYLWHYPVIVLTTPLGAPPSIVRASLQIAATIGLAALSWHFVENPVRHGALGRLWERLRQRKWSWPRLRPLGWAVLGVASVNAVVVRAGALRGGRRLGGRSGEPGDQYPPGPDPPPGTADHRRGTPGQLHHDHRPAGRAGRHRHR